MLRQRVITAAVLLVVFALVLFVLPNPFFLSFVVLVVALGAWEWSRLAGVSDLKHQVLYAAIIAALATVLLLLPWQLALVRIAALAALVFWAVAVYRMVVAPALPGNGSSDSDGSFATIDRLQLGGGAFVLLSTALSFSAIRFHASQHSVWLLFYVMALVWAMDIGAYFAGRRFGRTKLAPIISPGKTREGVYGGLVCACCLILLALVVHPFFRENAVVFLVASVAAALVSVAGDLYESRLKRFRGFKDSSQLLPGHGGVLDRIDGVVAALPVFLALWIWV